VKPRRQADGGANSSSGWWQEVKWTGRELSWTAPPNWKQDSSEFQELFWSSPGGDEAAHLIVSISPMDDSFPTDSSIQGVLRPGCNPHEAL